MAAAMEKTEKIARQWMINWNAANTVDSPFPRNGESTRGNRRRACSSFRAFALSSFRDEFRGSAGDAHRRTGNRRAIAITRREETGIEGPQPRQPIDRPTQIRLTQSRGVAEGPKHSPAQMIDRHSVLP